MNENPTNADEQCKLGYCYLDGDGIPQDMKKAVYWFTKAAEQGDSGAQFQLGRFYSTGKGVPNDFGMAIQWYTKAAEQGNVVAMYNLSTIFWNEDGGVPRNVKKAKYWTKKAAEKGLAVAESFLFKIQEYESRNSGCYIATCVYGSYNCPEVWALRLYRDIKLSNTRYGRWFIRVYYKISPKIVELFGNKKWFNSFWKPILNKFVRKLQNSGIDSSPYSDV